MASPDAEILKALDALTGKVRAAVKAAVHEQAEAVAEAQRDALRGLLQEPDDSGDLLASIQVEDGRHDAEAVVVAGGPTTTTDKGFDRALGFEYGTSKQPARPFFRNTADAMARDIERNIAKAIEDATK